MRRRQVLAGSLALVTGGLAGCIAGVGSDGATTADRPTGTTSTTESSATTDSDGDGTAGPGQADRTTVPTPETDGPVAAASLRVTGAGCGDATDEATVSFGEESVVVTGTITGKDACSRPRLGKAVYDADAGELRILVETYSDGEMCAQCLAALEYEATVRIDGGPPASVVVHHRSRGEERTVVRTDR